VNRSKSRFELEFTERKGKEKGKKLITFFLDKSALDFEDFSNNFVLIILSLPQTEDEHKNERIDRFGLEK